ncbi:DUF6259 domain-containing protein [Pedobacter sp. ASV1-7]|uniref:DUF6259 domain-containing protein n=1 Tax=Pedobacter sp. ASV1-7 TaxID=3145237 RepID=UPI0032E92EE0
MFKSIITVLTLLIIMSGSLLFTNSRAQNPKANYIVLNNTNVRWAFDLRDGKLLSFKDLSNNQDFLVSKIEDASIWELTFTKNSGMLPITINDAQQFEFKQPSKDLIELIWKSFKDPAFKALQVRVTINLNKQGSSFWNIALTGIANTKIEKVIFPRISGIKNMTDEYLVAPNWMGELIKNPRRQLSGPVKKYELYYPGHLSMQFMALYGKSKKGFYAAANDIKSFRKDFAFLYQKDGNLSYQLTQFLPLDNNIDSYTPSYVVEIASFEGDWISAAKKYKVWGSQQYWAKESRLKNGLTPDWLTKTALWVWNRGESQNVLEPATDLKMQLGLPVGVLWHWWHNGSYDDSFPDYIPPREGEKNFVNAIKKAKDNDIQAIVYMNSIKWGNNMPSYYKENATPYTVKEQNGESKSFVYNIFTKKALTYMCMTTPFWKEKYSRIADTVLSKYGVGGIYMDQACLSALCYDPAHGHSIGGGNYWVPNFTQLTKQIREKAKRKEPYILAGEGGGESWLPTLDAFLTLQVSSERYAGISDKYTIPLFQAVYHEYGITFGNYSSLLYPPYDELWPAKYALKKVNEPLDKTFNQQFLMEQARSFVWGMQPAIANYHSSLKTERKVEIDYLLSLSRLRNKALKYLLYGSFARPPQIVIPQKEIAISKLSIYAGQDEKVTTFKKSYPMIYSGSWKSTDGCLAITLASIQEQPYTCKFNLLASDYGMKNTGKIYLLNEKERIKIGNYKRGKINVDIHLASMGLAIIEVIPDRIK